MIFVDTSAWYARIVPTDPNHPKAVRWTEQNKETLITTDYVLDETLTLLKIRGQMESAIALGESLFNGTLGTLHFLTEDEIKDAFRDFTKYTDKDWSFTDITSKVVIERLGISCAFVFDRHFHQFGSIEVVPK